jgi:hypothetical protein
MITQTATETATTEELIELVDATAADLAAAARHGWIVQDRDGLCWWADSDGLWYPQGEFTDLVRLTMLTAGDEK